MLLLQFKSVIINMDEGNSSDKMLVTIQEKGPLFLGRTRTCHVPREATVHYLRTFIAGKYSNSKDSLFLFAYGTILNNSELIENLYQRFKSRIGATGLEIQVASMSSF